MVESTEFGGSGIRKWALEYRKKIADKEALQRQVDDFMAHFDGSEALKKLRDENANQPDSEGWTKVTRRGKKKGIPRNTDVTEKILEKERLKNKKKETQDFYKFQVRQSKLNHLNELKEKFEQDKKRIAVLRAARKFKPY